MDPVTQGVVGAAFAQTRGSQKMLAKAAVIGALAGMAPDLDVLIRSASDPLFALEFHRHFTHSLLFIPFGAALCAAAFYSLLGERWQLSFWQIYVWSFIGYATHGLLDGCTSYGTQLLWPLTNYRFSWDIVSVVDLAFTLPLLALVILAARRRSRRYLWVAMTWGACYLSLGVVQHERAIAIGEELLAERGHHAIRLEAKPSFTNLAVWKLVYETEDRFYVDAVKPGLFENKVWPGSSIVKVNLEKDFRWLDLDSQQAEDVRRFDWFSSGYIAIDPQDPLNIVDVRYSMLPHQISPLWGIRLSPDAQPHEHVDYYTQREAPGSRLRDLVQMIFE